MQQVYQQDYSCILPPKGQAGGLFIGNLEAAQNLETLQKHNIKAVLTSCKGVHISHPLHLVPHTLKIEANDHESYDLSVHFDEAADFIASILDHSNIMVHCLAGVSRSVSLVIAFFIKHRGMTFQQAFSLIKARRRIISPNEGFIQQLKKFQAEQRTKLRSRSPHNARQSPQQLEKSIDRHFQSAEKNQYRRRSPSPTNLRHTESKNVENLHNRSFYNSIQDLGRNYRAFERSYYSPSKQLGHENSTYADMRRNSMVRPSSHSSSQQGPVDWLSMQRSQHQTIDMSDIDRKIENIRKKYTEYGGQNVSFLRQSPTFSRQNINYSRQNANGVYARQNPTAGYSKEGANYARYHLQEPRSYSKSTLQKAEQLRKRSFNYLQQYEKGPLQLPQRKPIYAYSRY